MFNISESDIGVEYRNIGPWRCYGLESHGETIEELFDNAVISEIDQDGEEVQSYSIEFADNDVYSAAHKYISHLVSTTVDDILLEEEYYEI